MPLCFPAACLFSRHTSHTLARVCVLACLLALPALAQAQTLTGTVRDASGSVLPGVSVEAASSALIEKTRTAVTDGTGQYRLTDLRPGTYTLTFSLNGFVQIRREDIEVSGGAIVAINVEMRVGGVQETITVTGETPIVDVQTSTKKQTVLDDSVIETLPSTRGYGNLLSAVPGIQQTGLDSGVNPVMSFFTAHGGRGNEGTVQIEGMNVGSAFNGGGVSFFSYDTGNAAEIQITVVGGLGEADRGGPQFNIIPKTGGNTFAGTVFTSYAGEWSQASNLDDELRAFNITEVPALIKNWDANVGFGGPIKRDKLWFFANVRSVGSHQAVAGLYGNANAGDPTKWSYVADRSLSVRSANERRVAEIRLTNQLTPRNKLGFSYDYQKNCTGSSYSRDGEQCRQRGEDWIALGTIGAFGSSSPESGTVWDDYDRIIQGTWSSPLTNKLLLEAGVSSYNDHWGGQAPAGALLDFIPVTELSPLAGVPVPFFSYRAPTSFFGHTYFLDQQHNVWRASASYVTGAHNLKVGYQAAYQKERQEHGAVRPGLSYLFFNGAPISLTQRIDNHHHSNRTRFDAFYVQDQWTRNRLTLQGAVRYEYARSWFPQGENGILGTSRYNAAPIVFPRIQGVKGFHDITPRMGAAYDLRGDGKTSIKVSFSKYLQPANNEGVFITGNPAVTFALTTDRAWDDGFFTLPAGDPRRGNFVADCDLNSPVANGECGPWANQNFGQPSRSTTVNPAVLEGWGSRPYDWQFALGIQHEVLPRVSAEVSYNRRWWGNFYYTDNRAVGPADFDQVTITAPQHAKLPDGGGYPVTFSTINPTRFGQFDNYFTLASDYGDVTYYWHGIDTNVNARMANGLTLGGGTTTGRGVRDTCEVTAKLPETQVPGFGATQQISSCAVSEIWQTNFRGFATYVVPKVDVQVSAIVRSLANAEPAQTQDSVASNGVSLNANYDVTTAQVQQAIGRPLAGGLATQSVALALPGQLYGPRINTVDFRLAKILRFGGTRTTVGLDLYNLFNANPGTGFNQGFGTDGATWLRPTTILNPRFARFNVTFNF